MKILILFFFILNHSSNDLKKLNELYETKYTRKEILNKFPKFRNEVLKSIQEKGTFGIRNFVHEEYFHFYDDENKLKLKDLNLFEISPIVNERLPIMIRLLKNGKMEREDRFAKNSINMTLYIIGKKFKDGKWLQYTIDFGFNVRKGIWQIETIQIVLIEV